MAYLCVDKDGTEWVFDNKPFKGCRTSTVWSVRGTYIQLPKGSIAKLIGRELTWDDEPYLLE